MINTILITIGKYLKDLLSKHSKFTGRLEFNFKDGRLKDINETKRTKVEE